MTKQLHLVLHPVRADRADEFECGTAWGSLTRIPAPQGTGAPAQ